MDFGGQNWILEAKIGLLGRFWLIFMDFWVFLWIFADFMVFIDFEAFSLILTENKDSSANLAP